MRAVIIDEPHKIRVGEAPEPECGPHDVVVEVKACGICGTDIHIIEGEFPPTRYPIIPGHEFGGVVARVGERVTNVRVGDRVGVDPTLACGACFFCQRGQGNLCEHWNGIGVTVNGGFAERVAVPERNCYRIPDSMSFAEAALIEPIACVVHGFHLLRPMIGESYLVYGAGPMGLQNAQLARFNGASVVALIDINRSRLERAKSVFGFDVVGTSLEEVRHVAPRGFDNVIEATGVTKVAEQAIDAVIKHGKLLLFGVCPPGEKASYEAFKIYNQEITIVGSMAVWNSYGPALEVIAAGAINGKAMVTHSLPIESFTEAVALVRKGAGLKVQIQPNA